MKNKQKMQKRPNKYTTDLADKICIAITTSTKGLKVICNENEDLPTHQVIYGWLKNPEYKHFLNKYEIARNLQTHTLADEIISIADKNSSDVQEDKLKIGALKRKASQLEPKKYKVR